MSKKITLITLSIIVLVLAGCSSKWDQSDPAMPEGLKARHEELLNEALATLETTPDDGNALFEAGFRYQALGDYKNAVKYYNQILENSENDTVTLNNMAVIYEDMEDYSKSAEYIRRLYVLDPTGIETIKDTVRILLEAGDPLNADEALTNFASQIGSSDPSIASLISELKQDIEDYKTANE